ncbi:hypothetical protein RB195_017354 [Necator americanus]
MAGAKDGEYYGDIAKSCRVSVQVGAKNRKKLCDADSFTKCIRDAGREALLGLMPRKKFTLNLRRQD